MKPATYLATVISLLAAPAAVSALCKNFPNGQICSGEFPNICGGQGTDTLICCDGVASCTP
ncbi:hypothetical protein LX36DRAFT_663437 [Colletotrichum falcatum]|nr:hypothetical protein LX36DRAFT_663437 [Colletotrichum falcatum]